LRIQNSKFRIEWRLPMKNVPFSSVLSAFLVLATLILLAPPSLSDIPNLINFQGRATDTSGNPVPDGNYIVLFRIYDAETGGTELWNSGNHWVGVENGAFSFVMGESSQPPLNLDFTQDYWLLLTFHGDDQLPRKQLGSVGYAFMASGLVPGTAVSGPIIDNAAIQGVNTATSGASMGLYGQSVAPGGAGIVGFSASATGINHGVYGMSASTDGHGIHGVVTTTTGSNYGVWGESASSAGVGVYGYASATTGTTYGIYGKSACSRGYGVYGHASSTSFDLDPACGVYGQSEDPDGIGIWGWASNGGHGIRATSLLGTGLAAYSSSSTGDVCGVYGSSYSIEGTGVYGNAQATTGTTYGVYGRDSSEGGYGVYYSGGLAGTGSKSCVVETSHGPTLLYCQESPENWFEDFGEGQLVNGRCHVDLDPLFLETVTIDEQTPMKVFVQLHDEGSHGVAVQKGYTGFDVIELENGRSSSTFDYRIVAKRKGFENKRLDYCKAAESDSYLAPELRETELRELEEERARMEEQRLRMAQGRHRHMEAPASRALGKKPMAQAIQPLTN
jgi:hypothetical protein